MWHDDLELEVPYWFARINAWDVQPRLDGSPYDDDDQVIYTVDRAGIKRQLIETNKTQNNMSVSDEDLRRHPTQVKAAILAELKRWVENDSFRRCLRKDAQNI